ncbi:tubulin polyglutamylase TTLL11 isoform X2 [Pleurodeles waltl]|uniref:tubulin polyglutamylase TTLL11 isoform X2 n=1 Tax=Pleurodeles waltl TaxID=8319 RepID=UPI00370987DD
MLAPGVFESVPSLVDEEVKTAVIRDTLRLVDPLKRRIHHNQLIPPEKPLDAKKEMQPVGSPEKSDQDAAVHLESSLPSPCLKQVFPKYAKQFTYLRVVERVASLFIRFLGIKGMKKMGPTGFRMFIRNCKLTNSNFSMASVDILYIDITRRWNSLVLDQRESGMCLQAFVEAFLYLAQRKFKTLPVHEQVESLIDLCECHLESLDEKRQPCTRAVVDRRAPLAGCHPDGLHVVPSSHVPLLNRTSTANKLVDYRTQHS